MPGARNNPTSVKTGKKGTDAAAAGLLYTFVSQTAKGWQPVLLGTNCQPFFVAYAALQGHLVVRRPGRNCPTQLPSAAQRYNTLDFVTKVVCHETPARFLWILPAQRAGRPLMTILSILLQDGLAKRESHPLINSQSQREIFGIFIKPKTALHSGRRAVIFDPGYIPPHLPGDTVKSHRAYSRYG